MPERIQRKRVKGWKMPENTVYVGRPTKWGNCYSLKGVRGWLRSQGIEDSFSKERRIERCVEQYKEWLVLGLPSDCFRGGHQDRLRKHLLSSLHELRGKNLACWCPVGQPCHADLLLKMANE